MKVTFYHKFYPMYIDIGTIEVNWLASCIFVALLWISCTNCAGVDMHTYVAMCIAIYCAISTPPMPCSI